MYSEKIVVGAGSEYPLNGLMTLPSDLSKPVPAVVMPAPAIWTRRF